MPIRERTSQRGQARGRLLRRRLAEELAIARRAAGLSFPALEQEVSVSRDTLGRMERGEAGAMRIDHVAEVAAALGLELAASLHPDGDPVRDRGHLALLGRLRVRLGPGVRWRFEVPIPIPGDRRSGDAVIAGRFGEVLVEAETHLYDVQAAERNAGAKSRDLGIERVILLVADTRHNRRVLALHTELRVAFPLETRVALRALDRGQRLPANAIVVL